MTAGQKTGDKITDDRKVETRVIKARSVHSIHSWWRSKRMLATYVPRMRNNNLEIRIAGDKRSPQLNSQNAVCITLSPPPQKGAGSDANSLAD